MKWIAFLLTLIPGLLQAAEPADTIGPEISTTRPTGVVTQLNLPETASRQSVREWKLRSNASEGGTSANRITLAPALVVRKTQALYWENGVGVDFTHSRLFRERLHFNTAYLTSRLGSAIGSNALKQDYFLLGADWHTPVVDRLSWVAGLHTGLFVVDYEEDVFANLPASSALFSISTGFNYTAGPVDLQLVAGYNLISGDGAGVPGSLFPVYYQLMVKVPLVLR
jgi:hypothetical protein